MQHSNYFPYGLNYVEPWSNYGRLSVKYANISERTGHEIFSDSEFDNFIDYMKIIYREITKNNIPAVYWLCKWSYFDYENAEPPWFDSMLEVALRTAKFDMFVLVFCMWNIWYNFREENIDYDEACVMAKDSVDGDLKIGFMRDVVKFINYHTPCMYIGYMELPPDNTDEPLSDKAEDDHIRYWENKKKELKQMYIEKLKDLGIHVSTLKDNFDRAKTLIKH